MELAPNHRPTIEYVRELRTKLNRDFPGVQLYDLPTDIVSKILNFGLPAPIDIQIAGRDLLADRRFADNLLNQLKFVPGIVDLRIQQMFNQPSLHIQLDRTKAEEIGFGPKATRRIGSPSGSSRSGSAGSQPAATRVGRGGWMGRTVLICRPRSFPVSATSPPAGRNPARVAVSPRKGSATCPSPTGTRVTLAPLLPSGATSLAVTGTTESSVAKSSSTVRPSARHSAMATRRDGSDAPDSTAEIACRDTPAISATCC